MASKTWSFLLPMLLYGSGCIVTVTSAPMQIPSQSSSLGLPPPPNLAPHSPPGGGLMLPPGTRPGLSAGSIGAIGVNPWQAGRNSSGGGFSPPPRYASSGLENNNATAAAQSIAQSVHFDSLLSRGFDELVQRYPAAEWLGMEATPPPMHAQDGVASLDGLVQVQLTFALNGAVYSLSNLPYYNPYLWGNPVYLHALEDPPNLPNPDAGADPAQAQGQGQQRETLTLESLLIVPSDALDDIRHFHHTDAYITRFSLLYVRGQGGSGSPWYRFTTTDPNPANNPIDFPADDEEFLDQAGHEMMDDDDADEDDDGALGDQSDIDVSDNDQGALM